MCNIFQHDQSDGEAVILWGGISMEEPTDRLGHSTLTAIRHWDKILGPTIRLGAVGPGSHLMYMESIMFWFARCPQVAPQIVHESVICW